MFNLKDKILKYCSFGLFLLAPIAYFYNNLYPHISSKTFFIYGVIEVMFFVWIYSLIVDSSYRFSKKYLFYFAPAVIFVLWMSLSTVYAMNPDLALFSSFARGTGLLLLYHTLAFSFVFFSVLQKYGKPYLYSVLNYFVLGGVLGVASIWMGPSGFNIGINALMTGGEGGLMGNSSLAAAYSFFTIAFSLFLIFSGQISFINKRLLWVGVVLVVFSPLFLNIMGLFNGQGLVGVARAAFITLFISIFLYLIFYLFLSSKKNLKNIGISLIFLSTITFGLVWNNFMTPDTKLHEAFVSSATGTRFIFWDNASRAIQDRPVLGYGLENYGLVFQKYFNPEILNKQNSIEGWTDKAHNIYFDMGVYGGYPAIILYSILLFSILYFTYIAHKNDRLNRIQASLIGSLVFGYILQNLFAFESNLSILAIFLLFSIVVYLGFDFKIKEQKNIDESSFENVLIGLFLCISFMFIFIYCTYLPNKKASLYREVFSASVGNSTPQYEKLLENSTMGSDWDTSDSADAIYKYYKVSAVNVKNDSKRLPQLIKNLDALINYLYKAQETNKTDFRLYMTTLSLENTMTYLSGRSITPELKIRLYSLVEKAKSLNSSYPDIYWSTAQIKVWEGDFAGAAVEYREAIRVAPTLPASYILALNFAKLLGDEKMFKEVSNEAVKNIPDFKYN